MPSRDELIAEMIPPNLRDLVRAHGGSYSAITPEAWAEYNQRMATWKTRTANGDFWKSPYRELREEAEEIMDRDAIKIASSSRSSQEDTRDDADMREMYGDE